MAYRKEAIMFRFLALTEQMVADLRALQAGVDSRRSYNRPGHLTGTFSLTDGGDYSWIDQFIRKHEICEEDYDIFVSLSTDCDSDIVCVPTFAMSLSRRVGGGISFSYTVLAED